MDPRQKETPFWIHHFRFIWFAWWLQPIYKLSKTMFIKHHHKLVVSTPLKNKQPSNWMISPGIGVKIKNIWNHHLELNKDPVINRPVFHEMSANGFNSHVYWLSKAVRLPPRQPTGKSLTWYLQHQREQKIEIGRFLKKNFSHSIWNCGSDHSLRRGDFFIFFSPLGFQTPKREVIFVPQKHTKQTPNLRRYLEAQQVLWDSPTSFFSNTRGTIQENHTPCFVPYMIRAHAFSRWAKLLSWSLAYKNPPFAEVWRWKKGRFFRGNGPGRGIFFWMVMC